ncbi:glutamate-5-semialdehyde dehydrogenase [Arcicella aurantiaca]|uniref:Gamma-glutamyl phosphate reductase n=1 Tax=Arcicella aurantiaca TaxID=591202 RepID=A0A316EEM8_9BACT|nr:glutamate-5-semialdehyde dehydrogenase [Arcicella aurantiaca]PWK28168.1 glutamate-5-semialdehyde dehydrogenase [Arcicella aurantiaca]
MELETLELPKTIVPLLEKTHAASAEVRRLTDTQKKGILNRLAVVLVENTDAIITENQKDLDRMDMADPKYDRLKLTPERIQDLANSMKEVADLQDPSGQILLERELVNGLKIKKIAVPMGVVGVIFEARPNVTVDVTALCIRSGNAVVLRGGTDAFDTNSYLVGLIHHVLAEFEVNTNCITLLPPDRELVKELLTATRFVDLIIPRGSESLIQFVRKHSLVPTIETGAGVCHTYVETSADLQKAADIVINAKVTRPSVCNSLDTVVIDEAVAGQFLPMLQEGFLKWNVEVFADEISYPIFAEINYPYLQKATADDFGREFLDYKCSVKVVSGITEAISHIGKYSSRHSEAIISKNEDYCQQFIQEIDAAAVYSNASTRFTDGGQFGLGAEIGISTQKLHARGPFALEKLVTEKWIITGDGQIRQ